MLIGKRCQRTAYQNMLYSSCIGVRVRLEHTYRVNYQLTVYSIIRRCLYITITVYAFVVLLLIRFKQINEILYIN